MTVDSWYQNRLEDRSHRKLGWDDLLSHLIFGGTNGVETI